MDFKVLGSILLIVGSSIGAGMLALPIATAQLGFLGAVLLLLGCWLIMTAGAFLLLEVNLWLPKNSNLISMAGVTIGPLAQIISWVIYLLLLYSLLCAYIAGGSDLFHRVLATQGLNLSLTTTALIFTFVFSTVVFFGIRSVDYVNRGLMAIKFTALFLLIALLLPKMQGANLAAGDLKQITSLTAINITITSFGFAAIVPSLRIYFAGDIKKLKLAIVIGSFIPLLCYILWDAAIMGVLPLHGSQGLESILLAKNSNSELVNALTTTASSESITFSTDVFTFFCMLTSFLGVALCIVDFLADGLQLEKVGVNKLIIHLLTFLPPLITVLFFPNIFIRALEYAGIYCVILLILLPAWMAWKGRYHRKLHPVFTVPGGKWLLSGLILLSTVILAGFVAMKLV